MSTELFYKKGVIKNFTKFTGKLLNLLLIKLQENFFKELLGTAASDGF